MKAYAESGLSAPAGIPYPSVNAMFPPSMSTMSLIAAPLAAGAVGEQRELRRAEEGGDDLARNELGHDVTGLMLRPTSTGR